MGAALTLNQLGGSDRKFYLYDTFADMSRPTDKDVAMPSSKAVDAPKTFTNTQTGEDSSDWIGVAQALMMSKITYPKYLTNKKILFT